MGASQGVSGCAAAAVRTRLCGFGACLFCLFAVTRVVTPGSGVVLAAGTFRASLRLVLGGKRAVAVVNARVCWRDGIRARREGAVSSLLLWRCNLSVFREGFGQKSGICGAGWPGGRSCCSWQHGTSPCWLVVPLICQWSRSLIKQNRPCSQIAWMDSSLKMTGAKQSNCWGKSLYFGVKGEMGILFIYIV